MRKVSGLAAAVLCLASVGVSAQVFVVSFPADRTSKAVDGRVLLLSNVCAADFRAIQKTAPPGAELTSWRC